VLFFLARWPMSAMLPLSVNHPITHRSTTMTTITATTSTIAFVVRAPGFYGDTTTVVSAYRSVRAAKRAAGPGWVVRLGALAKGDRFCRAAESIYPVAQGKAPGVPA
jgi:hypothetical protein